MSMGSTSGTWITAGGRGRSGNRLSPEGSRPGSRGEALEPGSSVPGLPRAFQQHPAVLVLVQPVLTAPGGGLVARRGDLELRGPALEVEHDTARGVGRAD